MFGDMAATDSSSMAMAMAFYPLQGQGLTTTTTTTTTYNPSHHHNRMLSFTASAPDPTLIPPPPPPHFHHLQKSTSLSPLRLPIGPHRRLQPWSRASSG
jgi:hypothetical protein